MVIFQFVMGQLPEGGDQKHPYEMDIFSEVHWYRIPQFSDRPICLV